MSPSGVMSRRHLGFGLGVCILWLLSACAQGPGLAVSAVPPAAPLLRLSPQSLGRALNLQQHLQVQVGEQTPRHLESMLEADAAGVRLALLSLGQIAARLEWDGQTLREQRAPWLPAAVSAERILSDLQLVYWPLPAIAAALPPGWRVEDDGTTRRLRWNDSPVVTVTSLRDGGRTRVELQQHREAYRLMIDSQEVQ